MKRITLHQLRLARACPEQIAEFERRFGDSIEVTEEACLAVADVFDWFWAAAHLLSVDSLRSYNRDMAALFIVDSRLLSVEQLHAVRAAAFARAYNMG